MLSIATMLEIRTSADATQAEFSYAGREALWLVRGIFPCFNAASVHGYLGEIDDGWRNFCHLYF